MTIYYMCTLPTGSCIGCNASVFRDGAEQRSRTRNRKPITIRTKISRLLFGNYHVILQHHHSLYSACITHDISQWITSVKDSSVEING